MTGTVAYFLGHDMETENEVGIAKKQKMLVPTTMELLYQLWTD